MYIYRIFKCCMLKKCCDLFCVRWRCKRAQRLSNPCKSPAPLFPSKPPKTATICSFYRLPPGKLKKKFSLRRRKKNALKAKPPRALRFPKLSKSHIDVFINKTKCNINLLLCFYQLFCFEKMQSDFSDVNVLDLPLVNIAQYFTMAEVFSLYKQTKSKQTKTIQHLSMLFL